MEDFLAYAEQNNLDGDMLFTMATPPDTEQVTEARELLAYNREIFNEDLQKVVALFGGFDSETLDFGKLSKDMEAASLMFMTQSNKDRMTVRMTVI